MRKVFLLEVFMVVIFFIGITITIALGASPPGPDIKQRISDQQKRIDERVKSGALNKVEAKILQDNINQIQQEEKRLTEEGKLTSEEKMQLHKMLDQNSKMIDDKKNNPVIAFAPQIHLRIAKQQRRIDEGIKSGELSQNEAKILQDNINQIQQEEKRLAARGKFTEADKERLDKMLDQNGEMIYNKKHNPVTAFAPQIQQQIVDQQKRIDKGIKSGAITQDEAKILQDNLNYIQKEEKRLTAEGKFTQADKERLQKMLDQNSDMIYDLKSNPVKRLY
jgi:polyhydroxyalkanoate synthesis regulator phasin